VFHFKLKEKFVFKGLVVARFTRKLMIVINVKKINC